MESLFYLGKNLDLLDQFQHLVIDCISLMLV